MKKKLKLITINCLVYFLLTTICLTFFYIGSLFAEQINLTLSGEAIQSSTDTWYGITGSASRAIDGNTNGDWRNGSVTHTYKENQPWWRVDLTNTYEISSIILWNRTDSCSDRLTNFNVSIFDESMQTVYSENFYESGGTFLPNLEITIPENTNGKYVRVQLNGSNYLSLAEVQVFGPGSGPAYLSAADFDKDGDVDGADLVKFSSLYGTSIKKTPYNSPWTWGTLPIGYFCDNWVDGECTAKRPAYSSISDRITQLKDGEAQAESGTIDETFINASDSGAFEFTTGEIVISNMFDSQWHDALGKNERFNTVWYPNSPIVNFEVISQVDERSAPSTTTNDKSYFFSYNQDLISLTDWIDYLETITCNFSRKIDTLVIYAHGGYNLEGSLYITSDRLGTDDLLHDIGTRDTLMRLKSIMAPNSHILLFSCNTGQDQLFVKELASLSGSFVHANSNSTGYPDDQAPWFNCASNSDCTDWQLDLVCPPSGDCYYE